MHSHRRNVDKSTASAPAPRKTSSPQTVFPATLKQLLRDGGPQVRVEDRECGECTACCTALAVHELQKPNNEPCCHLGAGCSIYPLRPDSCREWSCLWLQGGLTKRCRPDRLGLVLSLDGSGCYPLVTAYETSEGAAKTARAQYVLELLADSCNMVLVDPQNKFTVMSPNPAYKAALAPLVENIDDVDDLVAIDL